MLFNDVESWIGQDFYESSVSNKQCHPGWGKKLIKNLYIFSSSLWCKIKKILQEMLLLLNNYILVDDSNARPMVDYFPITTCHTFLNSYTIHVL